MRACVGVYVCVWQRAPKTFRRVHRDRFSYTVVPRLPLSQYRKRKQLIDIILLLLLYGHPIKIYFIVSVAETSSSSPSKAACRITLAAFTSGTVDRSRTLAAAALCRAAARFFRLCFFPASATPTEDGTVPVHRHHR